MNTFWHEARGFPSLERAWTDLRYAARGLWRAPRFTMGAVLVLAFGIGINVAVFTVAHAALFRGFSGLSGQDRLVYLTTGRDCCVSYQDVLDWRAAARSFEDIAAVADLRVAFDAGTGAETATATAVTTNTFTLLGARPALGRDFVADDDRPGANPVVMLSDRFWQTKLLGDRGVLGRVVRIDGVATTVVGIMPAEFVFPQNQDLWLPVGPRVAREPRHGDPAQPEIDPMVYVPLRQRPASGAGGLTRTAVPPQRLRAEMRRVVQSVDPEVPLWLGPYTLTEWRSGNYWRRGVNSGLAVTFAVAALIIAAVGLFAMLAQDVARRSKELAVRVALGATRRGIAWLVVRDGLAPASVGLATGVVASLGTNRLLSAQLVDVPFWDPLTLALSGVILILAALAGCALPAHRATRMDPLEALRTD